jgi:hypothetical protein
VALNWGDGPWVVQGLAAQGSAGSHRVRVPDALIAAAAADRGFAVLHYDHQSLSWSADPGSENTPPDAGQDGPRPRAFGVPVSCVDATQNYSFYFKSVVLGGYFNSTEPGADGSVVLGSDGQHTKEVLEILPSGA